MFLAAVLAGLVLLAVDVVTRRALWSPLPLAVAAMVTLVNGAIFAATSSAFVALSARLTAGLRRGAVIGAAAVTTALAARQALQLRAPLVIVAPLAAVTMLLVTVALARLVSFRPAHRGHAPVLVVLGGVLVALDRTWLAGATERSHDFIETLAHLSLASGSAPFLAARRSVVRRIVFGVSLVALTGFAAFSSSARVRRASELPSTWEEPVFVQRWLRGVRRLAGAASSRDRLREKYGVAAARAEAHGDLGDVAKSGKAGPHNVVVFFVDALRADVANDPAVMPETVAWARRNVSFRRAYASGSSTVLTLAPLFGCRYDTRPDEPPRLVGAARAAGMRTAMVIPRSARDYHRGAYRGLRFDEEIEVDDDAHAAVAEPLVDRTLDWVRGVDGSFFLWVYQYDVHAWLDLDDAWVEARATESGISKASALHWRYLAAARGVDRAFARLLHDLEGMGRLTDTTIVFVSDHGEALGQHDFWAHSTYLWESLLRVPLVLQLPGVAPRTIDTPVSTIDLGPTLFPELRGCHGRDLAHGADRATPILFSAVTDGELRRVGLLDRDRKLVVDLRDADARLYRVDADREDDVSATEAETLREQLSVLVRAPLPWGRHEN